jgi:DNA-binding XRE family transcriptional regulator
MAAMKRVHRNLSRDEVEALRDKLTSLVPGAKAEIPDLLRMMRLIARKSQSEYARLCGVAPRVLADVEAGKGHPRIDTLEKLLRPFGYRMGVVAAPSVEAHSGPPTRRVLPQDSHPRSRKTC